MLLAAPVLRYINGFTVTGLQVKTHNQDESHAETAKIPDLWQRFYLSNLSSNSGPFEVYSDYESDTSGLFTVTVGIANAEKDTLFSTVDVHAGNYLVFEGQGPLPFTVIELWKKIWDYFAAGCEYERSFVSDFEAYNGTEQVTIYIGVKSLL